jgi:hypothetical protein
VRALDRAEAMDVLGEGFHTSLRKGSDDPLASEAWRAIDDMPPAEWGGVLAFLVDGLESMGIRLVEEGAE